MGWSGAGAIGRFCEWGSQEIVITCVRNILANRLAVRAHGETVNPVCLSMSTGAPSVKWESPSFRQERFRISPLGKQMRVCNFSDTCATRVAMVADRLKSGHAWGLQDESLRCTRVFS